MFPPYCPGTSMGHRVTSAVIQIWPRVTVLSAEAEVVFGPKFLPPPHYTMTYFDICLLIFLHPFTSCGLLHWLI